MWNTFFKIVFIASQAYIINLMLVDYKPTHDPNQDTFKVEYLLGGAAVLGIVLPPKYMVSEVCACNPRDDLGMGKNGDNGPWC